jgi:hypothetical protein
MALLELASVGFGYGVDYLWLCLPMAWLWWAWIRYDYGATVPNAISSNL